MADGILSVILVTWIVWLLITTPYVVRRASMAMSKAEFEMLFDKIIRMALCLFVPCVLIFGLLSWRFFAILSHDVSVGNIVLWVVFTLVGLMLLVGHGLVNAVYYVSKIHLGAKL